MVILVQSMSVPVQSTSLVHRSNPSDCRHPVFMERVY